MSQHEGFAFSFTQNRMSLIAIKRSELLFPLTDKLVCIDLKNEQQTFIDVPCVNSNLNKHISEEENNYSEKRICENITENIRIISVCVSNCENFLAISTNKKRLIVYDNDFKIVDNWTLQRSSSKIRFTNDASALIVADKTGDAYLYKLGQSTGDLLLGHLSMLLDILVTAQCNYVVTADRDEKIRVSCFPNAYNIVSYCLGHKEFITNIELLNDKYLISASGDGTVRFWEFLKGKLLHTIHCNDYLTDKEIITNFTSKMDSERVEINALPITNICVNRIDSDIVNICVTLYEFNGLQIHKVTVNNDVVQTELLQVIDFETNNIFSMISDKKGFYVLNNNTIDFLYFDKNENRYCKKNLEFIESFFKENKPLINFEYVYNIPVLYKRQFDNLHDYQERKKMRLETRK